MSPPHLVLSIIATLSSQVGIHERSAREKISHVMNESGMAHIMNDEATRKYFQAFKRLITFVQRAYPTDPSR